MQGSEWLPSCSRDCFQHLNHLDDQELWVGNGCRVMSVSRYSCLVAPEECSWPQGLTENPAQISFIMQMSFLLEHRTRASSKGCFCARARQQPHKGTVRKDEGGGRWAALFCMTEPAMLLVTSLLDTQQSPAGTQRSIEQAFD